jgi:hypothetical protein
MRAAPTPRLQTLPPAVPTVAVAVAVAVAVIPPPVVEVVVVVLVVVVLVQRDLQDHADMCRSHSRPRTLLLWCCALGHRLHERFSPGSLAREWLRPRHGSSTNNHNSSNNNNNIGVNSRSNIHAVTAVVLVVALVLMTTTTLPS